ncbi:MAG: hypothetical protein AMXMBFR33_16480 [Candidatus Xenobia bacterium]
MPISRFSAGLVAALLAIIGLAMVSARTVARWFKADKLKPWRFRSWVTPVDLAKFLPKAEAILDIYERIPDLAEDEVILSVDEKTSIQARKRDSYRPAGAGEPAHVEHTYKRCGFVHLFAALNVATGKVFGQVTQTKTFSTFSQFITVLIKGAAACGHKTIHLILDNGSTHRPKYFETWISEQDWLGGLSVIVHWLPVRSSWLNQVEIFFSELQQHVLTPNDTNGPDQLGGRIIDYIDFRNEDAKPYRWTYTSADLRRKYGASHGPEAEQSRPEVVATPSAKPVRPHRKVA